jgi:CheY-like chemotaxis protein
VQFYEREEFLARSVARFFATGLRRGDPVVTVSAPHTFDLIAEHLGSERCGLDRNAADRVQFVNAHDALARFMVVSAPDPMRFEHAICDLLNQIRLNHHGATIWFHGEMVDVLCSQRNHTAAIRIEELWNGLIPEHEPIAVLHSYAIGNFEDHQSAELLKSICQQHTHGMPAYGISNTLCERATLERIVLLQRRAQTSPHEHEPELLLPAEETLSTSSAPTIYVIDDDPCVRRSLTRLLLKLTLPVRSFSSAEEFLAEIDDTARGCVVVDVHLAGMTGLELQDLLMRAGWSLPVIAMSGSHDPAVESRALRQGAARFLRKPIEGNVLFDAILLALE